MTRVFITVIDILLLFRSSSGFLVLIAAFATIFFHCTTGFATFL